MPVEKDLVKAELARLEADYTREKEARDKAYDMHGGDNPLPMEKPMPKIIAQFGDWAVTPFGVECLTYAYQIQWDSILDPVTRDVFWLENLATKSFVNNIHDVAEAIRVGRQVHHYLQNIDGDDA